MPAAIPPTPARRRARGTGTATPLQTLQYWLRYIHGRHSSQHGELSLATQPPLRITAFHSAIDLGVTQFRTPAFVCALAGCTLSHSIVFYMGFAPHPQRLSPLSRTNQRNYCCNTTFLHCHKWEVDWKQSTPVLAFLFPVWGLSMFFWFEKISGNLQLLLLSSGRQTFSVNDRVPPKLAKEHNFI